MNSVNMSGSKPQSGDGCLNSAANLRRLRLRFTVATTVLVTMAIANEVLHSLGTYTPATRAGAMGAGLLVTLLLIRWLYKDAIGILNTSSAKVCASNKQTRDAESTQARFLETMSHELRTPLSSIIGSSEMLNSANPLRQDNKHINTISQELPTSARPCRRPARCHKDQIRPSRNHAQLREHLRRYRRSHRHHLDTGE